MEDNCGQDGQSSYDCCKAFTSKQEAFKYKELLEHPDFPMEILEYETNITPKQISKENK